MARVDVTREAAAVGLGVVDEIAESIDRNRGMVSPFRNVTDWYRLGTAVVGGLMVMQDIGRSVNDVLLYSGSTLAVKSVSRLIRTGAFGGAFRTIGAGVGAHRRSLPAPSETVNVPVGGRRRHIAVSRI